MKLSDLRPGAIFVTVNGGIRAVASEYHYPTGQVECILLASGEYAHFPNGNDELVQEINLETIIGERSAVFTALKQLVQAVPEYEGAEGYDERLYSLLNKARKILGMSREEEGNPPAH